MAKDDEVTRRRDDDLFKCYGFGYCHSSPDKLYPLARCLGHSPHTKVDYSRFYLRRVVPPKQTTAVSPKSLAQSLNPFILTPSLSPNVPTDPSKEQPRFPRPVRRIHRKEDFCLGESLLQFLKELLSAGLMTVSIDSLFRCKGLAVEVLFEEDPIPEEEELHDRPLFNQEMGACVCYMFVSRIVVVPVSMEGRSSYIDEDEDDEYSMSDMTDQLKQGISVMPKYLRQGVTTIGFVNVCVF